MQPATVDFCSIQPPREARPLTGSAAVPSRFTLVPPSFDELAELAAATRAGDAKAARALIRKLHGATRRIVRKVLGASHPDLDDVTQEAALALLKSLATFRGESSVGHYANSITLRTALAARRRYQTAQRWLVTSTPSEALTWATLETPLAVAMSKRSSEVVQRILRELPAQTADFLALHTISGYTTAEVASLHGVSEGTVRSQLRIGKKEFRRLLRRELRSGRLG
jgi:RNA polymerase sigma-70 factor (ECF subfamily)